MRSFVPPPVIHSQRAPKLDYARHLPPTPRFSSLAVVALIVSILACPCLSGSIVGWVNMKIPSAYRNGAWMHRTHQIMMGTGVFVPLVSMAWIGRSNGRRRGMPIAGLALAIGVLWWVGLLILMFALRGFHPGPHD